jgi:hypothetical protein
MKAWPVVSVALVASPAFAGHRAVALQIGDCDMAPEIRKLVALELGKPLVDEPNGGDTRASVMCAETRATLRVDDPVTGKELSRVVDLEAAIPKGRARLVALAVVELISTSWTELDATPASTAATPTADLGVSAQLPPVPTQLRVLAIAGVRKFGGTSTLVGGGARIARDGAWLGWLADVEAHHGTSTVSLGQTSADVLDAAGALSIHRSWSRTRASFAAGVRGGAGRLAGSSTMMGVRAESFWGPWFGAFALGSISVAATSHFAIELTVEGGRVISPLGGLVDARREVAIDGAWIGVHLGVGTNL